MPSPFVVRAQGSGLDWNAIKGDVSTEVVAVALMGEPSGRNGRGAWWRCPFHDDRNPSLHVDPERGRWRCYGCGEHGDAPALAMRLEGLSFPQAVRRVAELCGLTPSSGDFQAPSRPKPVKAPERPKAGPSGLAAGDASALVEDASKAIWTPDGSKALSYLHGRGFSDETIRAARLGWIRRATVPRRDGGSFGVSGICIPWFDRDRLALVKVRRLDDGKPKYVEAFRDSPAVFPSLEAIRPGLPLAIVEGEFDALLLHQLIGDFTCVATIGSASSGVGADVMDAVVHCDRWHVAHDADGAGDDAAAKWLNFPWAVRVRPPSPAKDWTEAHALGFNVVRNLWLGVVRDAPRPSWEDLEAERWGPALAGPGDDADDDREWIEERRAIAMADGCDPPDSVRPFAEWMDEYRGGVKGIRNHDTLAAADVDPIDEAWRAELNRLVAKGDLVLVVEEVEDRG